MNQKNKFKSCYPIHVGALPADTHCIFSNPRRQEVLATNNIPVQRFRVPWLGTYNI
jgi:hypothetical protein